MTLPRRAIVALALLFTLVGNVGRTASAADRAESAANRVRPALEAELAALDRGWGAPVHLRIFKLESELEIWAADSTGTHALLRTLPICAWSGELGPKLAEGDGQAPEGFYTVRRGQLNPYSRFHLSFDLGFPNAYDRAHGRTGSYLMVHGACVSIGCYALTDVGIDVVYTLVDAALTHGQRGVPVHVFPFRYDRPDAAARIAASPWRDFWRELEPAWEAFEATRRIPDVRVEGRHYAIEAVD
jgi:murein L,D-transpeptidase YafK